jgi:DNA-binding Lrp family transcriptional regulator
MSEFVTTTQSEQRWTPTLIHAGFTIIPNVLLEHQRSLELDALDLNILAQLFSYWWSTDNLPHPSKKTIALRMGVDVSTVRRRIAKMEKSGLIKRKARFSSERRRQANGYDFTNLIRRATPLALRMIHRRAKKKVTVVSPSLETEETGTRLNEEELWSR